MSTIEEMIRTPWVHWTLAVAYAGTILSIVGIIVSENRNPVKSLAWVTVLLMFPIGGIVLYVFFGRSIKNTRMISRRGGRRGGGGAQEVSIMGATMWRYSTAARSLRLWSVI